MKMLPISFEENANKSGLQIFNQIERNGNICIYERKDKETFRVKGYEVFITKIINEGTPLPGGNLVKESYEQYPGASVFGKTAWAYGGWDIERAKSKFDYLVAIRDNPELIYVDKADDTKLTAHSKEVKSVLGIYKENDSEIIDDQQFVEQDVMEEDVEEKEEENITVETVRVVNTESLPQKVDNNRKYKSPKKIKNVIIPDGEFDQNGFAIANGMKPGRSSTVYLFMKKQVEMGIIKKSREIKIHKKPTFLYVRAS